MEYLIATVGDKEPRNLGGLINKLLGSNYLISTNIKVANNTFYGSYNIPDAIGFSTPCSLLHGGRLEIRYSKHTITNIHQIFRMWSNIFSDFGTINPIPDKFTLDKKTCHICSKDYIQDDNIIQVKPCLHTFHSSCVKDLIHTKYEELAHQVPQKVPAQEMPTELHANVIKCPICDANINA